mgnify:CR=1 FL=1
MNNHINILDNIIEILLIYRQEINKNKIENKSEEMILLENDLSNIEDPLMPDRTKWCNEIAYTEWTVDEIEQGLPLQRLLPKLEEIVNVQ